MRFRGAARGGTETARTARPVPAVPSERSVDWKARWLDLTLVAAAVVVVVVSLTRVWTAPLGLDPLLATVPALAAIGAVSVRRPLAYGAAALVAAVIVDETIAGGITSTGAAHALPLAAIGAVAVVTVLSAVGLTVRPRQESAASQQQELHMANVMSVAEAAQRAVLSPLPEQLGPLRLSVVYLAAAAEARVGGDLYDVANTGSHGIRLIIGDVRGKGLGAVEVAADVIGRFREVAHEVHTLDEIAYRLDAGLTRRWGQHEEFVTALLAQIEPEKGRLTILNCGHPPPILISPEDGVTILEVRAPAPPLGLLTLGHDAGAKASVSFKPNDQLLLYTDGVTEARDASREFYPLDQRIGALAAQARATAAKGSRGIRPRGKGAVPTLLELVRDDLLRHVGAPPEDDVALLLVRAPEAWPGGHALARAARQPVQPVIRT